MVRTAPRASATIASAQEVSTKPEDLANENLRRLWCELQNTAMSWARCEPALSAWLGQNILDVESFREALARRLTDVFCGDMLGAEALGELIRGVLWEHDQVERDACADLLAIREGDPATVDLLTPFVFFKGFASLALHRVAHRMWLDHRPALALALQQRAAMKTGIDIHPGAQVGRGILMDHAGGIVIGETATVSDDVIMFHNVTLGGTGRGRGDRHPKIGRGSFIGAGATLLGNIRIGDWTRIGAGSVVLTDVPDWSIAVGAPARISTLSGNNDWPDNRWCDAALAAGRSTLPPPDNC